MYRSRRTFIATCVLGLFTFGLLSQTVPASASNAIQAVRVCDHHRYFKVVKAARHGKTVVLTGHTAKRVCGPGGSNFAPVKTTSKITLRPTTVVRVFKVPGAGGPVLRTIKPAAFPKYLKQDNRTGPFPGEDNYRVYGATKRPTEIVEQFQE